MSDILPSGKKKKNKEKEVKIYLKRLWHTELGVTIAKEPFAKKLHGISKHQFHKNVATDEWLERSELDKTIVFWLHGLIQGEFEKSPVLEHLTDLTYSQRRKLKDVSFRQSYLLPIVAAYAFAYVQEITLPSAFEKLFPPHVPAKKSSPSKPKQPIGKRSAAGGDLQNLPLEVDSESLQPENHENAAQPHRQRRVQLGPKNEMQRMMQFLEDYETKLDFVKKRMVDPSSEPPAKKQKIYAAKKHTKTSESKAKQKKEKEKPDPQEKKEEKQQNPVEKEPWEFSD